MTSDPLKTGSDVIKAWWPFIVTIFLLSGAWTALDSRVSAIEKDNRSVQEDVRWLRANTYNLLIKQGVQPVNP